MADDAVENGVNKILRDNAAVAAVVGTRIDHVLTPQASALPRLTLQVVAGGEHVENLQGSGGLAWTLIQIDCYGTTKAETDDLGYKVRQALHGYRGTVGDYNMGVDQCTRDQDLSDVPFDGSDKPMWRRSLDFKAWLVVTVPTFA